MKSLIDLLVGSCPRGCQHEAVSHPPKLLPATLTRWPAGRPEEKTVTQYEFCGTCRQVFRATEAHGDSPDRSS